MSAPAALLNNAPRPGNDPVVDKQGFLTPEWDDWFQALTSNVSSAPARVGTNVQLTEQNAAIPATFLTTAAAVSGVYRITYYVRVTTVAGVTSAVQPSFTFTDAGVPQTFTGTNVNGNTTTSYASGTVTFYADGETPITYQTAYASNPASAMRYKLIVILELVQGVS